MKKEPLAKLMAKRLTKALREKRRWLGVLVEPTCTKRSDVQDRLDALMSSLDPTPDIRLMDFFNREQRHVLDSPDGPVEATEGVAILRIHLKDARTLRALLEGENAITKHGFRSLTTSGKIRLVRERLGLPKPKSNR